MVVLKDRSHLGSNHPYPWDNTNRLQELGDPIEEDSQLTNAHLALAWEWLLFQYQADNQSKDGWKPIASPDHTVEWLDPSETVVYLQGDLSDPETDSFITTWRKKLASCAKLLAPIFTGGSCNENGHWTLLVVQKKQIQQKNMEELEKSEILRIAYIDSLSVASTESHQNAAKLLRALCPSAQLPEPRNHWNQPGGSGQCGFAVVHYMEEEIGHSLGGGLGCVGWPNIRKVC